MTEAKRGLQKLSRRDLEEGMDKSVKEEELPEHVQEHVRGSQEAGCHSFTYPEEDALKTITWEEN